MPDSPAPAPSSGTSAAGPLRVERRESGVVVLTLANPERRNVMDAAMSEAWGSAVEQLRDDREVRCVVVAGEGSAFCSGGDVTWIGSEPDKSVDELRTRMMAFYRTWLSLRELEVPTVAAVNGPAIGAGAVLALMCDIRYAAPEARFGVPFTRLGMHAGMATTWLLPEVVGIAAARELLLTGRLVDGEEMVRLGLATSLSPADRLLEDVLATADRIAATAPVATRLTKVALRGSGHASYEAAVEWEALAQPVTLATEDLQEGLRARAEKRRPRFTGR